MSVASQVREWNAKSRKCTSEEEMMHCVECCWWFQEGEKEELVIEFSIIEITQS